MRTFGLIIIIIGLSLSVYTAYTYSFNQEVISIGKVVIIKSEPFYLKWSPLVGLAIMIAGGIIFARSSKKQ